MESVAESVPTLTTDSTVDSQNLIKMYKRHPKIREARSLLRLSSWVMWVVLVSECACKYVGNFVIPLSVNMVGELVFLLLMFAIHFCTKLQETPSTSSRR